MTIREKNRKNRLRKVFILFIFIIILLTSYFLFIKKDKVNIFIINEKKNIKYDKIEENELIDIVNNELYILDNLEKISNISNKDKLCLAINLYYKDNNDIFTPDDLTIYFNKTSIYYLGIKHESLSCNNYYYSYDKEKNTYIQDKELDEEIIKRIYSKKISFSNDKQKYLISYNFLFTNSLKEKNDYEIYGTFDNATKKNSSLGKITYSDNFNKDLKELYNNKLKDTTTYTYIFEKIDNKIRLIDFKKNSI